MLKALSLLSLLSFGACMVGEADDDDVVSIEGKKAAELRIIQHNIEKRQSVLERVIAHAQNIDAHAIALQEVCPAQVAWLRANVGTVWTVGASFGTKRTLNGCDLPDGTHDVTANVVIWTKGTGGKLTEYTDLAKSLPTAPGNRTVCVEFERANVPVHLCSVHLISADWKDPATQITHDGAAVRLMQTTALKQIARDNWFNGARNHFGIIAGDFNGSPTTEALDKMYDDALGGNGEFTEYNRSGNSRTGQMTATADGSNTEDGQPYSKKIDYVFFSTNRAPLDGPAVQVVDTASDHNMVTSTVMMRK